MRSIRFAVLSNARKYVTERVVKNGRNDSFSVSLDPYKISSFFNSPYTKYAALFLARFIWGDNSIYAYRCQTENYHKGKSIAPAGRGNDTLSFMG